MAVKEHSFDISAQIDKQEFKNALEQTKKEIASRFDFKGVTAEIDYDEKAKTVTITSSGDSKLDSIIDVFQSKLIKRDLSVSVLKENSRVDASGGNRRAVFAIADSLAQDDAKKIVKKIKDLALKVQASIRGDEVRVVGKSIDDLQVCIKAMRENFPELPLSFINLK